MCLLNCVLHHKESCVAPSGCLCCPAGPCTLAGCAGENESVRSATQRPRIVGRGLRILSMDGGGMKVPGQSTLIAKLSAQAGP